MQKAISDAGGGGSRGSGGHKYVHVRNFWRKQKNDVRGTLRTLFVEPLTDSATPMKYCKNVIFWLDFMVHLFLLKEPYLPFTGIVFLLQRDL